MSLLELRDVHTYYGHIHALKGISLRVEETSGSSLGRIWGSISTTVTRAPRRA